MYVKSIEAMEVGKPVVWAMVNLRYGDQLLEAMDIEVVCPENHGAIATAMRVAQQYLDRADSEGLPTDLYGDRLTARVYASTVGRELNRQIPPDAPFANRRVTRVSMRQTLSRPS